jgi:nucleoside-diphosphate-sugar epimerase
MRSVVTGGAGFIGTHLVEYLVAQGNDVLVLDNFSTGSREALEHLHGSVAVLEGDIRDTELLCEALRGADTVFHLAALVSVAQSVAEPQLTYEVNCTGTVGLLEAARLTGVRRVVQASTCAVYGNTQRLPVRESDPTQPLSPYAAAKLGAEQAGQLYSGLYGLETVALRFFNVYGPRQSPTSSYAAVVPRFIATLLAGDQPTIYGDGGQSRDFIFVEDVVGALVAAAAAPGISGAVLNVGRGEAATVLELASIIAKLVGTPLAPRFEVARSGEVRHSRADPTALAEHTGFRALYDLRAGLARTVTG